jgi:hypothetical protein
VLPVGIELHRRVVTLDHRVPEPCPQRAPDPEVERELQDDRARGAPDLRGAVTRAVRHHDHVEGRLKLPQLLQGRRERLFLVVGGDDDEGPHAEGRV